MGKVAIIGGGAFGTGMACVARRSGNEVTLWAREPEVVDDILRKRENTHFLAGTKLPQGIEATNDLAQAAEGADLVLMAVPAQHTRAVAGQLRPAPRFRAACALRSSTCSSRIARRRRDFNLGMMCAVFAGSKRIAH